MYETHRSRHATVIDIEQFSLLFVWILHRKRYYHVIRKCWKGYNCCFETFKDSSPSSLNWSLTPQVNQPSQPPHTHYKYIITTPFAYKLIREIFLLSLIPLLLQWNNKSHPLTRRGGLFQGEVRLRPRYLEASSDHSRRNHPRNAI